MKIDSAESTHMDTIEIRNTCTDSKDIDLLVDKLFRSNGYSKKYRSEDIQLLSLNIPRVKRAIQELAKSKFPHPVTLHHLLTTFNERFKTNFAKTSSVTYALKLLEIDWHHEVNKKLGLYNYDFLHYAENVKDELHKKQCLAMAHLKEGKSFSEISNFLNIKPSQIKKWFVSFVSAQKLK